MPSEIHVEPKQPIHRDEYWRLAAEISGHLGWRMRPRNGELFFELPRQLTDELGLADLAEQRHDTFVRATIFPAMECGRNLVVHGRVSATLLANLERYQHVVHSWWPHFRPVEVRADEVLHDALGVRENGRDDAVLTYSGGLDSTYTLYRHKKKLHGDAARQIGACVFVHGFDISLTDRAYNAAFDRCERITSQLDVPLIPVRTNLRTKLPSWGVTHGAALAAVLSLFERRFKSGLIAGSHFSDQIKPYISQSRFGSTAWTDPLLSSESFSITYDGDWPRVEKCAILQHAPDILKNVRVCWQGKDLSTNCGKCGNCTRLMLCKRAVGVDDLGAFESPLTKHAILKRHGCHNPSVFFDWLACYRHAERHGRADQEEFKLMRQIIDRMMAGRTAVRQRLNDWMQRIFEHWH